MPIQQPPILTKVSIDGKSKYKITTTTNFTTADLGMPSPVLIDVGTSLISALSLSQIQGAASIPPMRTCQLALVIEAQGSTAFPQRGTLYTVIDQQQVFAFEVGRQSTSSPLGSQTSSLGATFPIVATPQSNIQFALSLPNYEAAVNIAHLYVSLFDFELPAFFAPSNGIISPWV